MRVINYLGNALIFWGLYNIWLGSGITNQFKGDVALGFSIGIPSIVVGSIIKLIFKKNEQIVIDREVVKKTSSDIFSLYLRPFESTNKHQLDDLHLSLFSAELYERDGFDDIERVVASALKYNIPLRALGKPGEHRGAARILTTDDEWQEDLRHLALRSKLIILLPSNNSGTIWEIKHLIENKYLSKTIFIMPPKENIFFKHNIETEAKWNQAINACKELGLQLPKLRINGAFFTFNNYGTVIVEDLLQPKPTYWRIAMQKLVKKSDLDIDLLKHLK